MLYKIVFALLKTLSRLPFWCLHRIADILFFILYYLIGYRKKVIMNNLNIIFPEKDSKELKKIAKKFVWNFADFLVESLKTLSITEKQLQQRYVFKNPDLIQKEIDAGKNSMILAGHFINWEWMFYFSRVTKILTWTAYTPLSNPIFDKLMVLNRERFDFKVVPSKIAAKTFGEFNSEGRQFVNCLMSDQSPQSKYKNRAIFLGKDVPFYIGPEAYAKKYNLSLFYAKIIKQGRSRYTIDFIPITLNPKNTDSNWITSEYIRLLEEDIQQQPSNYLLSHRRFKHARD